MLLLKESRKYRTQEGKQFSKDVFSTSQIS